MTRTKQCQTIVLEIDLIAYGDGDPEADEIRVNGKSYGVRELADKAAKARKDLKLDIYGLERVALWAADPKEWELAE